MFWHESMNRDIIKTQELIRFIKYQTLFPSIHDDIYDNLVEMAFQNDESEFNYQLGDIKYYCAYEKVGRTSKCPEIEGSRENPTYEVDSVSIPGKDNINLFDFIGEAPEWIPKK